MSESLGLLFRWLHIIPALVMVGGVIFMRCCLQSASSEQKTAFFDGQEEARKRWARLVMASTLFLLVSGLYNAAMKAISYDLSMTYNILLLAKILLGLAVFYFLAVLSGRSERAKRFRENETHWLNVLIVLMLLIVLIAGYMKISSAGFEEKVRDQSRAPAVECISTPAPTACAPRISPDTYGCWAARYSAGTSLIS